MSAYTDQRLSVTYTMMSIVLSLLFQSLMDIVSKVQLMSHNGRSAAAAIKKDCTIISGKGGVSKTERPFDAMNNIVANLLLSITRYTHTHTHLWVKNTRTPLGG